MFGIGMQEMVIVGLLFLIIFGPSKLPAMARDLGPFVNEARRSVEEFKEDLVSEEEGGQELRKGRDPEASRDPEENVGREEVAAIESSALNDSRATLATLAVHLRTTSMSNDRWCGVSPGSVGCASLTSFSGDR